jgi:hypothetical protein
MTKVSDMLGHFAEPRGNSGYSVEHEDAVRIVIEMRRIMGMDLDELDVATAAQIYNGSVDGEEMIAAWELLNAGERRAWRNFVEYEEFLKVERLKHVDS